MKKRIPFWTFGVLVAMCVVAWTSRSSVGARVDPYKSFNFIVQIDGAPAGGFTEVSGLSIEIEPVEYRSGDESQVRKIPGPINFGDVTLKRPYTGDATLSGWIDSARTLPPGSDDLRKDVTITILDPAGETVRTLSMPDCFPIRWSLSPLADGAKEALTEEVVLACDVVLFP